MIEALIIEDEYVAVEHLRRLLGQAAPDVEVCGVLQTVEEAVDWFAHGSSSRMPDVVFLDIHLADGLAFRIFDQVTIPCPVVFTTAYDEYALKAFEVNSVDYLLKPINAGDLQRALQKLRGWLAGGHGQDGALLQRAMEMMQQHYRHYRRYFLIPVRDKLVPLDVESIACVCVREGGTVALTADGHSYMLDKGLDAVMTQLDPRKFFRVNRQYIVAHRAIKEISMWLPGKYWLRLCVDTGERVVVPRARVNEFKGWYAGEMESI